MGFPANAFYIQGGAPNTVLQTIILPKVFVRIFDKAFKDCKSLVSVTILKDAVPELGVECFAGCDALEDIFVLETLVEAYKANASWASVKEKIKAIPVAQ